ncbi:MAG TPA: hypothetical protein VFV37_05270, partial [Luteibaculaceae bacterium]|nr:hypothetical protein [Luteibaculaceae bacterium]
MALVDQKSRRSLGYLIAYQALLAVLKALTQGQYTGWKAALWWIFFVVAFSAPILIWHRRFQIPLRTYLIFSTVVLSVLLILRILLPLNALT